MTLIISIFRFYCKSEHKQVQRNKIKQDMCKSDNIFPYLQISTLFKWLLKFISWWGLSQKWMKKFLRLVSFRVTGNWAHLAEKNTWPGAKINKIFMLSLKCCNRIIIKKTSVVLWASKSCYVVWSLILKLH